MTPYMNKIQLENEIETTKQVIKELELSGDMTAANLARTDLKYFISQR